MTIASPAVPTSHRTPDVRLLKLAEAIFVPAVALLLSALLFSIFLLVIGKSPVEFFTLVWTGGFGSSFSFQQSLQRAAPLILTGLAFAIPARIGLTVIGAEGALVLGGLCAAAIAIPLVTGGAPVALTWLLMAAAAMLASGIWIGIAGWLRHYRGVNETI